MKRFYQIGFLTLATILLLGAIGDTFKSLMIDSTGLIQNNLTITDSNQILVLKEATNINQLVRFQEWTNSGNANFPIVPISKGGTGTNTTYLIGSWTNTGTFSVGGITLTPDSFGNLVQTSTNSGVITFGERIRHTITSPIRSPGYSATNTSGGVFYSIVASSTGNMRIDCNTNIVVVAQTPAGDIAGIEFAGIMTFDNIVTSPTNNSLVYQLNGATLFTGNITNNGVGSTNIQFIQSGTTVSNLHTGP